MIAPEVFKKLKLLVVDIDGTLTDGRLYYGKDGEAMKVFDVRDGHGLKLMQVCLGMKLAVLTGRKADLSRARLLEFGFSPIFERSRQKGPDFERLCAEAGVSPSEACFMGDDVNDLPALERAGLSACPADAAPEVLAKCAFVSKREGGRGAVRDLCEAWLGATVGWPPPEPPAHAFEPPKT
ncbi:MAG: HAD hydrolase family protein [Deltaproteobacteria bacterium]|nr:HAD hydrolase family protein [Deltaproteobacteria bacterium]